MKKVIVPLDFSDTSNNALDFAIQFANEFDASIQGIHVYKIDASQVGNSSNIQEYMNISENKLNQIVDKKKISEDISLDAKLLVGFPGDKILTYAKELDNSCVVLGTHGEKDVLRNLFGSVSTKVGMDCDKPVWVIPPDAKFSEFKKIAFCTNDPLAAVSASEVLYPISNKYKSEVHLLNVFEFSDINKEEIINAWSKIIPKEKIKIKTLYDIDIVDALYKYCQENDIDLIVINRKQRSFLSMLFNKSITKKMIIKSDIPLLIMHS